MRRRNEERPLEKYKAKANDKKNKWTISIVTRDGTKGYLKPLPNGNYEIISTIQGAAIWKCKLTATLANEHIFSGEGTIEEVDVSNVEYVKRPTKEQNIVVTTAKVTK